MENYIVKATMATSPCESPEQAAKQAQKHMCNEHAIMCFEVLESKKAVENLQGAVHPWHRVWLQPKIDIGQTIAEVFKDALAAPLKEAHKHAHNMKLYAEDAAETPKPWLRWEAGAANVAGIRWQPLDNNPLWARNTEYRRKPKTFTLNGVEVPLPLADAAGMQAEREHVYTPNLLGPTVPHIWKPNDARLEPLFKAGMAHATPEAAVLHAQAMLAGKPPV